MCRKVKLSDNNIVARILIFFKNIFGKRNDSTSSELQIIFVFKSPDRQCFLIIIIIIICAFNAHRCGLVINMIANAIIQNSAYGTHVKKAT